MWTQANNDSCKSAASVAQVPAARASVNCVSALHALSLIARQLEGLCQQSQEERTPVILSWDAGAGSAGGVGGRSAAGSSRTLQLARACSTRFKPFINPSMSTCGGKVGAVTQGCKDKMYEDKNVGVQA